MLLMTFGNSCFARVEMKFDESKPRIKKDFYQYGTYTNRKTGKEILGVIFAYDRVYSFNKEFDEETQRCTPYDFIYFCIDDYDNRIHNLKDGIKCTQVGTGKSFRLPLTVKMEEKPNKRHYTFSAIAGDVEGIDKLIEFVDEGNPLIFTFTFFPPGGTIDKLVKIPLNSEEMKEFKSVVYYDLYEDVTQKDNIKRAVSILKGK
mgnify:CR=1 FL=1